MRVPGLQTDAGSGLPPPGRGLPVHCWRSPQPLFAEALELEPLRTLDDAEWTIEKPDEGAYLVTTDFCLTYGPVDTQRLLDELLSEHGIWLECKGRHVRGAATFEALAADDLLRAIQRLKTVESWCLAANKRVNALLDEFWSEIRHEAADQVRTFGSPIHFSSPENYKRRSAILDERADQM